MTNVDQAIAVFMGALALMTVVEVVMLRKVYSPVLRNYIILAALLFLSVSLAHLHWVFEYLLWVTSLLAMFYKGWLMWIVRERSKSKWRTPYMGDIYRTTGMLNSISRELKKKNKAK